MVASGGCAGSCSRAVVVRLRRVGTSVSAPTPRGRAGSGVLAGGSGGRGGVVGSTERPIRAAATSRANCGPHYDDVRAFDRPRDYRAAGVVPERLSISLAHGVSFGLTGSIEGDGRRRTKGDGMARERLGGVGRGVEAGADGCAKDAAEKSILKREQ